ncbi:MAG: hypothetical protein ACI8Z7_000144 [Candidatus Nanohaloarchaea archaeon]|jgi:hypothetical protein
MLPDKHVKQMEKLESRKSIYRKISASVIFLLSVFVIGPVVHELSHMVVLESINCEYILNWGLNINGIHGSVRPVCVPNNYQLIAFYSVGYLSTAVAGGFLSFTSLKNRFDDSLKRINYTSLGTGLLVSTAISLSLVGDMNNLAEILEIGVLQTQIFTVGFFLAISATVMRTLQVAWDDNSER